MFWRKAKFEPEGYYDGYGYKLVKSGKVDVDFGDRIVRFGSLEEMVANLGTGRNKPPSDPKTGHLNEQRP
jgi:hypothetical protein